MPTKIIHGFGSTRQIPEECKRIGIKKVILVTDEGLVEAGGIKETTAILEGARIPYAVFDKVEEDPCTKTVHEGENFAKMKDATVLSSWAVKALFTNLSKPFTDAIALRAIQMMSRNLVPAAFTDNMAAKSEQLLASAMANTACGNAKLGLVHAFSDPLRNLRLPHGLACGLMLPFVMEYNLHSSKAKFAEMAVAMGEKPDQPEGVLANKALERVKNLYVEVHSPTRVTEKEVPRDKLDQVIKEAAASQMRSNVRRTNKTSGGSWKGHTRAFRGLFSQRF